MDPPFQTVCDLRRDASALRDRSFGVIEAVNGRFVAVHLRPWPKTISWLEIWGLGRWRHNRRPGNRCLLYYNQPWRCRNFLALMYVISNRGTTLATVRSTLTVLDEIARLKQSDAIVCHASNLRISDRFFQRWGWEPHCPRASGRHFIKRRNNFKAKLNVDTGLEAAGLLLLPNGGNLSSTA